MEIFNILVAIVPKVLEAARAGQFAWEAFLEAKKVEGNEEINAKLQELKSEFTRHRIIAEAEANG